MCWRTRRGYGTGSGSAVAEAPAAPVEVYSRSEYMRLTAEATKARTTGDAIGASGVTQAQLERWEKMAKAPTKAELNASGALNLAKSHDTIGINDTAAYRAGLLGRRTVYGTNTTYQQQSQNLEVAATLVKSISVGQNDVVHVKTTGLTFDKELSISIKDNGIVALKGDVITVAREADKIKVSFSSCGSLTLPADVNQSRVLVKGADGTFQTLKQALDSSASSTIVVAVEEEVTPPAGRPDEEPIDSAAATGADSTYPHSLPPPVELTEIASSAGDTSISSSLGASSATSRGLGDPVSERTPEPIQPPPPPPPQTARQAPVAPPTPSVPQGVAIRPRTGGGAGIYVETPRTNPHLPGFSLVGQSHAGRGSNPATTFTTFKHPKSQAEVVVTPGRLSTGGGRLDNTPTQEFRRKNEKDPFLVVLRAEGQIGQVVSWKGEFEPIRGVFLEPQQALPLKGFSRSNDGPWSKSINGEATVFYDPVTYRFVRREKDQKHFLSGPTGHNSGQAMKWVRTGHHTGRWEFDY